VDLETVQAKMAAHVDAAGASALARAFGWTFEVDGLVVYVVLTPRRRPANIYLLRATFDDFPRRAPSYVFVDRATRQETESAWPPGVRHGGPPSGICTPGTREFHEHLHRGDSQYPWDPDRYTFLATLTEIHRMTERALGA
jgi:hypothetical protein